MAIIKKYSPFQNLSNFQTFLIDNNPNSDYFRITEFKDTFTGGKNGFLIEGSQYLKETTEVKIEVVDVEGNPVYYEPGEGIPEYYEGLSKLVSIHVYPDTPIGLGKITILGELKQYVDNQGVIREIPDEWKGVYNVKWEKEFKINKNLVNEDIVRFYKRPQITITELIKPIFSKTIPSVTDVVEVSGIPQNPPLDTNLTNWRAGTNYKLIRATGSWDRDVDENTITISSLNYSPTIIEVLNDTEVLVDVPYSVDNLVKSFVSQSASVTYSDFNNQTISDSALTGSFAKIDMSQLKTFVGDVARVKIFRKSRNTAGDFQFVQESKLESTELLRDVTTQSDNEISYGNFTETNLSNYWETSSNDHPTSIDSSLLSQAVKIDYNTVSGGVQKLITSESFSLSKDVEYTLSFKTLLDGTTTGKYIKAYFSGSYTNNLGNPASFTQSFMTISGSDVYKTRQNVSQNILAERDINAKLVLEFKGDDWYVSSVSLRNAQETSFSPDEFILIQDIPRKLASETFDFRFEFYDINNNYIPVDITATATFTGGNDFPSSGKILTFESDRNAFRFSTGSIANPYNQTIQFKTTAQNLTGSILFESQAFDVDGNYLSPSNYSQYPGLLTNVTTAGALLTLNNFTGSYSGAGTAPYVGSIVYTASLESLQEFETVYRLEDGDNAPALVVTSNANQFIYEPTKLTPKPSGQSITVRAQRKNLASLITPITVTSGSNLPALTYVSTTNGIDTYTISATEFSQSFAANNFDEVTYSFVGSDVFGNNQTDEITLSKVINFDAVSFVLSNESTSFPANSTGVVTGGFAASSGSVRMFIGSNEIQFDDSLSKNTFEITNLQGTNCTPNGGQGSDPTTNSYGITAMTADEASLAVTVTYKAGDNSTTQSFDKLVTYTKAKKAQPSITFSATPQAQTIDAKSTGDLIGTIQDVTISGFEGNTALTYNQTATLGVGQYKITDVTGVTVADTTPSTSTIDITSFSGDTATGTASIAYRDSEGTSGTQTIKFSLSKSKKAVPVVLTKTSPTTQTINSSSLGYEIPQRVEVVINEGGTDYSYDDSLSSNETFRIDSLAYSSGSASFDNEYITLFTGSGDFNGLTGSAIVDYKNSEGTTVTNKIVRFDLSVSKKGTDGEKGDPGEPGISAFSVELVPPSQEVIIDIQDNITTPDTFAVQVFDTSGNYTYSATLASTASFYIDTLAQSNTSTTPTNSNGTITPGTPSNANGSNVTFNVYVKGRDGNTSAAIPKTHKIRVVADGSTGPGIVFTGPWDTNRIYQYDISNGRRDAVLYDDIYYATLQQAGTSIGTPDTEPTYWESLGSQDFFVAAKIAIFEESYIQNTLNIGTTSNTLSAANITLRGGTNYPYFSLGQSADTGSQGYGVGSGIFIGRDTDGQYKASFESGSANYLKWDGEKLQIQGDIDATSISADSGSIGGWTINSTTLTGGSTTLTSTGNITVGSSSDVARLSSTDGTYRLWIGNATAGSAPFRVTKGGALTATSATISGTINASGGTFTNNVNINGTLTASGMKFGSGVVSGKDGIHIDANDYWYDDGNFSFGNGGVTWNGTTLTIAGTVNIGSTAASTLESNANGAIQPGDDIDDGTVGGWNIDGSYIWTGTKQTSNGYSTSGITLANTGAIRAKNFYIDNTNGNAFFRGEITATSGYIGTAANGFEINSSTIETTGLTLGASGNTYAINAGNGNFTVDHSGNLVANNATITGTVSGSTIQGSTLSGVNGEFSGSLEATSGKIGGWGIAGNEIYSPDSGTKVMSLTAGTNPAISILSGSNEVVVVDINGQQTLTDLGAGGTVSSTSSPITYDSDGASYNSNAGFSINLNPDVTDAIYDVGQTPVSITIGSGDEGTYTVSATVSFAPTPSSKLADYRVSGGTTSTSANFQGGIHMGWFISTQTLNPKNFILDSQYSQQTFNVTATNNGFTAAILTNRSATVSKAINFATAGTYYIYPAVWKLFGNLFLNYSGTGYTLNVNMYSPKFTNLAASVNIFKSELNAGGIQVVSSNTNYVTMERQPGISSTSTVMLEVGGSIEATGNITANASDERLKDIKSKIENPLSKLQQLNGVVFNWNELAHRLGGYDTDVENIGLIAQEVQKVLPQAVTTAPINKGRDENYLTIWYDKLVALLVEGMKELNNRVDKLEEENKRLKDGNS